jgi:hypothetical protein
MRKHLKIKTINGSEFVEYRNGKLIPIAEHRRRQAALLGGRTQLLAKRRNTLSVSKVKRDISFYLEDDGKAWLNSEAPSNVVEECGLEKGTKITWITALRIKLGEAAIFEKSAASARVLLEIDKFLYTKNKERADRRWKYHVFNTKQQREKDKAIEIPNTDNFGDLL